LTRPNVELGMEFAKPSKFRTMVRNAAVSKGSDLKWKKNEGTRINTDVQDKNTQIEMV